MRRRPVAGLRETNLKITLASEDALSIRAMREKLPPPKKGKSTRHVLCHGGGRSTGVRAAV